MNHCNHWGKIYALNGLLIFSQSSLYFFLSSCSDVVSFFLLSVDIEQSFPTKYRGLWVQKSRTIPKPLFTARRHFHSSYFSNITFFAKVLSCLNNLPMLWRFFWDMLQLIFSVQPSTCVTHYSGIIFWAKQKLFYFSELCDRPFMGKDEGGRWTGVEN